MKCLFILLTAWLSILCANSQKNPDYSKIDMMLVRGDYNKVIDTCRLILSADSLNAAVFFKMGLAYQNMMPDEKSFDCFRKAYLLDSMNNQYRFMVAKGYYTKNKYQRAKPQLEYLCTTDSMNWSYAYYLTSVYQDEGRINKCIGIYERFLAADTTNYVFLDKLGYAYLLKRQYPEAIGYYTRSMKINEKNINAIKNLSFLYPYVHKIDTAIVLLTRAISLDPEDMDLYARRATIYFAKDYTKRALDDYLKILASGDTTFLYLKRAGIGYTRNLQPRKALPYLLLASKRDTTDYETLDFIAQNYQRLRDLKNTEIYYNKIIALLTPFTKQLGIAHLMLGDVCSQDSLYVLAVENYQHCIELLKDVNVNLMLANIYDEKLGNAPKAMFYYRQFLAGFEKAGRYGRPEYVESVKKRLSYLEEQQKTAKK